MSEHTENSIVINAPFDLVWAVTNDVAIWPDLFTEYAATEIIERNGSTVRFRLTLHPDEKGRVWTWVSERTMDREGRKAHAHRVETGPFDYMNLDWQFEELDEGVRMTWTQDFQMKPDAPLDDAGMADRINTNSKIQMQVIAEKIELIHKLVGHRQIDLSDEGFAS